VFPAVGIFFFRNKLPLYHTKY